MRFVFAVGVMLVCAGAAHAQRRGVPVATACNTDDAECREDCTMEFGASIKLREQLGRCMEQCRTRRSDCTERWTELHQAGLDTSGFETERTKTNPPGRSTYEEPREELPSRTDGSAEPPARADDSSSEDEAAVRSTRTRVSDAPAPAPQKQQAPDRASASEPELESTPTIEEQEAAERAETRPEEAPAVKAAPAEKKKASSSAPPAPPEPKRRDISEWDEGDIDR